MTTFNYPFLTADEIKKKRHLASYMKFFSLTTLIGLSIYSLCGIDTEPNTSVTTTILITTIIFFITFFLALYSMAQLDSFSTVNNPELMEQLTALCQEFPEVEQYRQRVIQADREFTLGEFNYITQWCDEQKVVQKQQSIKNKLYQP